MLQPDATLFTQGPSAHESVSCDSGDLSTQRYITANDDVKRRAVELV